MPMPQRRNRPPTPEATKRALRKHAGYGCCRCGFAIYQYHHIIPWEEEEHFRVEDMMILCPNCHSMATDGALTIEQQREVQKHPHNVTQGYASGALMVNQSYCAVVSGGVLLVGTGPLVQVDSDPLLTLSVGEGGDMRISVNLLDEHNDVLAIIENNEWISGDPSIWDMESAHQKLVIRERSRHISLDFNAKAEPARLRADLWKNGRLISLNSKGVTVSGHEIGSSSEISDLGLVDLALHIQSEAETTNLVPIGAGPGILVSESDLLKRWSKSINLYRKRHPQEPRQGTKMS